jgi:hypothetical protein
MAVRVAPALVGKGKVVPTCGHQFVPFGFVLQGYAGGAVEKCLLLDPARIRGDRGRVLFWAHHVEVAAGIDHLQRGKTIGLSWIGRTPHSAQ